MKPVRTKEVTDPHKKRHFGRPRLVLNFESSLTRLIHVSRCFKIPSMLCRPLIKKVVGMEREGADTAQTTDGERLKEKYTVACRANPNERKRGTEIVKFPTQNIESMILKIESNRLLSPVFNPLRPQL